MTSKQDILSKENELHKLTADLPEGMGKIAVLQALNKLTAVIQGSLNDDGTTTPEVAKLGTEITTPLQPPAFAGRAFLRSMAPDGNGTTLCC